MTYKNNRPRCKMCLNHSIENSRYCQKHADMFNGHNYGIEKKAKWGGKKEYSYLYYTKRWQLLRKKVIYKNPFCNSCKKLTDVLEIDHIIPHKGDVKLFYDESNLQGLCKSCHTKKTIQEIKEAKYNKPRF